MIDMLELIKLACKRYPADDDKAIAFAKRCIAICDVQPARTTEEAPPPARRVETPPAKTPAPTPPAPVVRSSTAEPRELGVTADKAWRFIAWRISSTGLSPAVSDIAKALNVHAGYVTAALPTLVRNGYLRDEGKYKDRVFHVLKWPAGVTPRETTGRADNAVAPASATPSSEPPPVRVFPAGYSAMCVISGCKNTRQPGRDQCTEHLRQQMAPNPRADMRDGYPPTAS